MYLEKIHIKNFMEFVYPKIEYWKINQVLQKVIMIRLILLMILI